MTLGIAQPAEAAPQPPKRQAKPKALRLGRAARRPPAAPAAAAPAEYVVAAGDTVSGDRRALRARTAEVLAFNGLGWSSADLPRAAARPAGARARARRGARAGPVAPEIARHVVVDGDTISAIAAALRRSTSRAC